ncbi:hypothetical protein B0H14DRAFT_2607932, partial [Mycena olivaceomarginata]
MANEFIESKTSQIYMISRAPSGVELIRRHWDPVARARRRQISGWDNGLAVPRKSEWGSSRSYPQLQDTRVWEVPNESLSQVEERDARRFKLVSIPRVILSVAMRDISLASIDIPFDVETDDVSDSEAEMVQDPPGPIDYESDNETNTRRILIE